LKAYKCDVCRELFLGEPFSKAKIQQILSSPSPAAKEYVLDLCKRCFEELIIPKEVDH
jgi:hypothetical protein